MLNRLSALSPPRISTLLMSVHINLCVTTAEFMNEQDWDCWDEYNPAAFTLYAPRGALLLCRQRLHNFEAPALIHQRTLDNLDHTCHPSTVDCHLCGRKTITSQNICSLSICRHLIKSTLSSQDKSRGLTMSVSAHWIYLCSEQVRETIAQTFIHKEQTHE